MTIQIRNTRGTLNKALTMMNLILFSILTLNIVRYKEIKDKQVPVLANICLLIFLGLGVLAALTN
ncbi:hypothetical protein [Pontibacter saemangeumensis]